MSKHRCALCDYETEFDYWLMVHVANLHSTREQPDSIAYDYMQCPFCAEVMRYAHPHLESCVGYLAFLLSGVVYVDRSDVTDGASQEDAPG